MALSLDNGRNPFRTRLTGALQRRLADTKTETARGFNEVARLARLVELQRGKRELAEQAAAAQPMREQAQKRRRGAVDLDADAGRPVANLGPALRHADAMRAGDEEGNGRAVIDGRVLKWEGFGFLAAIRSEERRV